MKIGFKGFRGFKEKEGEIEIKKITILTGKNSSGKSTYLKLLKLISKSFRDCQSLNDIFKIKINTDINEKLDLSKLISDSYLKCSIEFTPIFYCEPHKIELQFKYDNYELTIESLNIINIENNENYIQISNNIIEINTYYLYEKYIKFRNLYNKHEELRFIRNSEDKNLVNNYKNKYGTRYSKFKSKGHVKNFYHVPYTSYNLYTKNEKILDSNSLIFNIYSIDNNLGYYNLLFDEKEDIDFNTKEIENIIEYCIENENEYEFKLSEFIKQEKEKNKNFSIKKFLNAYQNRLYSKYIIKDLTYFEYTYGVKYSIMVQRAIDKLKNDLDDDNDDIDFEYLEEEYLIDLFYKNPTLTNLTAGTMSLFEQSIISLFKTLSSTNFHSSVNSEHLETYNIFNSNNSISKFLKKWTLAKELEKEKALNFINKVVKKINIADRVEIELKDNLGFIYIVKNNHKYSISNEGTGAFKLLSTIFYLVTHGLNNNNDWQDEDEREICEKIELKKSIVIEEPETNLHPNLQSKIADLLIEFSKNYNLKIIIETHSEYLIRKLQFLIAKKNISENNVGIYYFKYDTKKLSITIENISIKKNGILSKEFETGFLDEANNLSINLFEFNLSQNN